MVKVSFIAKENVSTSILIEKNSQIKFCIIYLRSRNILQVELF